MNRKSRDAALDADGRALWNRVARSVDPLPGRHIFADPVPAPPPTALPKAKARPRIGRVPAPAPPAPPAKVTPPNGGLDGSWERQIARGRLSPDATIDLHGLTLDQAWRRLDFALEEATAIGTRVLLVVTGRGAADPSAGRASAGAIRPRGMIRAKLEDWIAASRHASSIASIRGAHLRHGGAGAVYLILRRRRG